MMLAESGNQMINISNLCIFCFCLNLCEIEDSDTRLFPPDFPSENFRFCQISKSTPEKFTYIEEKAVVTKISLYLKKSTNIYSHNKLQISKYCVDNRFYFQISINFELFRTLLIFIPPHTTSIINTFVIASS